jgi:hypothetical protein
MSIPIVEMFEFEAADVEIVGIGVGVTTTS